MGYCLILLNYEMAMTSNGTEQVGKQNRGWLEAFQTQTSNTSELGPESLSFLILYHNIQIVSYLLLNQGHIVPCVD